jgi:glycosyltransferase involved in cell wall biosynthesis
MSRSHKRGLSVVVITYNERGNLPACLASVSFADELLVVDAESTDGSPEMAKACGAHVLSHAWDGYAKQRQRGFDATTRDWVLWVDADERVSPELARAISEVVAKNGSLDAYRVPRRHFFLGDWLRHGGEYPAPQLRLVRREHAVMRKELVHETIVEEGLEVGLLTGALDHLSTPSLRDRLKKTATYARLAAEQAMRSGRRPGVHTLLANPVRRTAYVYVKAEGYRDGWRGLLWSLNCGLEQALIGWHLLARGKRRA